MPKKKRGSSMGKGTRDSRKVRQTGGRKYLTIPEGWNMYKAEPGLIKMDILPYVVKEPKKHPESHNMAEDIWYRYPYKLHGSVGPNRKSIICPSTIGKPCPVCEKRQEIFDDPDMDNKAAGKFKPSGRSLFIIKIKGGDDKKNIGKKFIWDVSDFCFFDQMDIELDHGEEEWNDFACLEGGHTLKVRLLEESFGDGKSDIKFPKCDRIDFIPRKDYDESILDEHPCLDDMILPNIKTYEEIQAVLEGDADDEEEDQDEKKSSKKTKKTKASKKKVEEPEEEEEDQDEEDEDKEEEPEDDDDDEEEEEEEPPKKKNTKVKPKAKKKPVEEEEEDDEEPEEEDDGEEEEDEPPKKVKRSPKKEEKPVSKKTTKKALKCPFAYQFGEEFGDHDECNEKDCEKYDACYEKYDELNGGE